MMPRRYGPSLIRSIIFGNVSIILFYISNGFKFFMSTSTHKNVTTPLLAHLVIGAKVSCRHGESNPGTIDVGKKCSITELHAHPMMLSWF